MRNNPINIIRGGRISLLPVLALAATLFVGGNLHAQSGDAQAKELLASSLPAGVSLSKASDSQMEEAVKAAVARDPRLAEGIVRVAIITKVPAEERKATPRRSRRAPMGDGKSTSSVNSYNPWATAGVTAAHPYVFIAATTSDAAGYIAAIVSAAVSAAPDRAAEIAAAAASVAPAYAVTITQTAVSAAPGRASEITQAVSAAVPSQSTEISAAAAGTSTVSGGGSDSGVGGSAVGAPSFPSGGGGGGGTGVTDLTPTVTSVTNQ